MKRLQQLQYKILLISGLSIVSVFIILVSNYKINELNHRKERTFETLTQISHCMGTINGLEKDFFNYEIINPEFHNTGRSSILKSCNNTFNDLEYKLKEFTKDLPNKDKSTISPLILQLSAKIERHSALYDSLSTSIRAKGFHDYGLIGEMRKEAHFIENYAPFQNKQEILMLRRHEKDYFLRKQKKYINKAFHQIGVIEDKIKEFEIDDKQKQVFIKSINNYAKYLTLVTRYNVIIGIKAEDGLKGDINDNLVSINEDIESIKVMFNQNTDSRIWIVNMLNLIALCILMVVVTMSVFTSKKLGFPIKKISDSIRKSIDSDFNSEHCIYISDTRNEIGQLSLDVQKMLDKIISSKEELLCTQGEIQSQHHKLKERKKALDEAFKTIEDKNYNLTSSITYAKRIQEAMFTEYEEMKNFFPQHFILYKPRDIVSGDFYMVYEKEGKKIIVAVDCTGHGVPGAFMTLLASMIISDYISNCSFTCTDESCGSKKFSPQNMLEQVDAKIRQILKQEKTMSRDGMDMAVCVVDEKCNTLTYSGAKMPIYLVQNNKLTKIKGSKRCIGGLLDKKVADIKYEQRDIELVPNTRFYLMTDGYQDQFGGVDDRKFKSKRIEAMIMANLDTPLEEQEEVFQNQLEDWMNPIGYSAYSQIDDIMVLGFEV